MQTHATFDVPRPFVMNFFYSSRLTICQTFCLTNAPLGHLLDLGAQDLHPFVGRLSGVFVERAFEALGVREHQGLFLLELLVQGVHLLGGVDHLVEEHADILYRFCTGEKSVGLCS